MTHLPIPVEAGQGPICPCCCAAPLGQQQLNSGNTPTRRGVVKRRPPCVPAGRRKTQSPLVHLGAVIDPRVAVTAPGDPTEKVSIIVVRRGVNGIPQPVTPTLAF